VENTNKATYCDGRLIGECLFERCAQCQEAYYQENAGQNSPANEELDLTEAWEEEETMNRCHSPSCDGTCETCGEAAREEREYQAAFDLCKTCGELWMVCECPSQDPAYDVMELDAKQAPRAFDDTFVDPFADE
jgi:hypothetical protein